MTDQHSPVDLHPHLLYCHDGDHARFATWRLAEGHETLALFTTEESAKSYGQDLADAKRWIAYQPDRDKLIDILHACRSAGVLYAALDPANGAAKTLFDIPRVLASASEVRGQRSKVRGQRSDRAEL